MREMYNENLAEVTYYKHLGRKEGGRGRIVKTLPVDLRYGHIAEVAVAGMLGRLQEFYKEKNVYFFVGCSVQDDLAGIDFTVNRRPLSLTSKFTYNSIMDMDSCVVEYNMPGIKNLSVILNYIGMDMPCLDAETVRDINEIWFEYMERYILDGEGVPMKHH